MVTQQQPIDLIVGAKNIAKVLSVTRRQVYAMREAKHPLIRSEPGLGLVASRAAIRRHFGPPEIANEEAPA